MEGFENGVEGVDEELCAGFFLDGTTFAVGDTWGTENWFAFLEDFISQSVPYVVVEFFGDQMKFERFHFWTDLGDECIALDHEGLVNWCPSGKV